MNFHFEEYLQLKFMVYDADDEVGTIEKSDFLGEAECTLADIAISDNFRKELQLTKDG